MIRLFLLLSIFLSPLANGQVKDGVERGSKAGRTLYHQVPTTSFRCEEQQWGGYYSDPEAHCQVFHICVRRHGTLEQFSFLCPNETVFHQELLVCVWWDSFDCQSASLHYGINENIFEEDDGSVGGRANPNRSGEKVLKPSRGKSALAIESPQVPLKTKSVPTASVLEGPSFAPKPIESNLGREGKTIGVTVNDVRNLNEETITTIKPEIAPTTKPKLQPSPILKIVPKAPPKTTPVVLPARDQTVEGRALPQIAVKIDNSADTVNSSLTPKASLDFVNNGQFIVRHEDDEIVSSGGNRAFTPEVSDPQAIGSRVNPTLSNESRSGKTLQTANEEINTARAFPKVTAPQATVKAKRPQNIIKQQPTTIHDNKQRRTTTVKPVTTTRPVTKTVTQKSPLKTTTALTPFTLSARKTTQKLLTTASTKLPSTAANLDARTTTKQPFNQRRNEKKINTVLPTPSSGNVNLLNAKPRSSQSSTEKPTSKRVPSSRAPNSFTSRLSSHDVLHELLKNITIIRAGELLNANFNKNSRGNVKRKVDNASAPVSSFQEATSALEPSQTFMSSRGVSRAKIPIHRHEPKISNKSSAKAQNPAVEHNIRIKSSSSHNNDLSDNLLSCVYYYGSKKRPNCNLVNQRAQNLQDLGLNNLLNSRSRLNKIDAQSNENDYSLSLDKEPHDHLTSNRRSFTVTDDNFNELRNTPKKISVINESLKNVKSVVSSDQPIELNQILNIPSTDFSLPSPASFVFPNVTLTNDHLSSHFLPDFASLTKNTNKPLILIVSSAEAASNEGNQKKVYINTLKSETPTLGTPISNHPSFQPQTQLTTYNLSSSSIYPPSSAEAINHVPTTSSQTSLSTVSSQPLSSSKRYLPSKPQLYSSSKTYLPASSPNYISSDPYLPSSRAQYLPSTALTDLPSTGPPASDLEDGLHLAFEPPTEKRGKRENTVLSPTTILYLVKKDDFLTKFN